MKLGKGLRMQEFPRFSDLTLEDKPILDSLLKETQPQISELTFTNLFVWSASEPVQTSQSNESVLIQRRRLRDGKTFLLPPLGKKALPDVVRSLHALNLEVKLPEERARCLKSNWFKKSVYSISEISWQDFSIVAKSSLTFPCKL